MEFEDQFSSIVNHQRRGNFASRSRRTRGRFCGGSRSLSPFISTRISRLFALSEMALLGWCFGLAKGFSFPSRMAGLTLLFTSKIYG